jgi:hypothetical protein
LQSRNLEAKLKVKNEKTAIQNVALIDCSRRNAFRLRNEPQFPTKRQPNRERLHQHRSRQAVLTQPRRPIIASPGQRLPSENYSFGFSSCPGSDGLQKAGIHCQ